MNSPDNERPRKLTANEMGVLSKLLGAKPFPGAADLLAQVSMTRVSGGIPTYLGLSVTAPVAPARRPDGPIPPRGVVQDPSGKDIGLILVWVRNGYLSGLEYAWFTDDPPEAFPPPEHVYVADKD